MSSINLQLDMDRVQSSVQAAIRPAVERALAGEDIEKIIAKALKNPLADYGYYGMIHERRQCSTLLDQLVRNAIEELAKEFVARNIREQKEAIEEGFRKALLGSTNKIVKAFAKAAVDSIEADWNFDFEGSVTVAKAAESDDE